MIGFKFLFLLSFVVQTSLVNSSIYEIPEPEFGCSHEIETPKTYTTDEIDLLARVVMSEGSVLPFEAKQAICETVLNRVDSEKYADTIYEVVCSEKQFSTKDNGEPTEECYEAVISAIQYRAFPRDMYWFRDTKYHIFAKPYMNISNMFFSTETDYLGD